MVQNKSHKKIWMELIRRLIMLWDKLRSNSQKFILTFQDTILVKDKRAQPMIVRVSRKNSKRALLLITQVVMIVEHQLHMEIQEQLEVLEQVIKLITQHQILQVHIPQAGIRSQMTCMRM
jgi:hypothetical protein